MIHIQAGVPQGRDLSPDLFNIFTSDIPQTENTILDTYADDTAILSSNSDPVEASLALQLHLNLIDNWSQKWNIKIKAEKSINVPFTLNNKALPALILQRVPIPLQSYVKYLGVILDKVLTWGRHLKAKRKLLNSRLHLLRPILKSNLPLKNNLFI